MLDSLFNPQSPFPLPGHAPFEIIIFDCDSTLCAVEGIDELARWAGKEAEVAELTRRAMNGELPLEAVYSRRLELLQPTREHLQRLARLYRETLIPDAAAVIQALQQAGREVFIVSGGLAEGVREFGLWLGLPGTNIHAVEIEYNQLAGRWWETWRHPGGRNPHEPYLAHDGGPLTLGKGKAEIIRKLRRHKRGRALLVGDGTSDLEASEAVDLFVGFGGVVSRERVRAAAPVFIHVAELAPVLTLALRRTEVPAAFQDLYARGLSLIRDGQVTFQSRREWEHE
ncbi:MAG: HAD-IB family phosphatase [Anaerolineales bacterium]|nr:HAD-IB family phosphatase [Anaerolineales bacterium]